MQMKPTIKQTTNKTKQKTNKQHKQSLPTTNNNDTTNKNKNKKYTKSVVSSSIHLEAWFSKHEKDQINHI
jgi:hypothetical protein